MVVALASCGVEARDIAVPTPTTDPAPSPGRSSTTTTDPDEGGDGSTTTTEDEPDGSTTTTTEPDLGGGDGGPGDREGNSDEQEEAVFAALEEDCVAGNDRACDLLFLTSPADSDYEDVGGDCGGRGATGLFCAEETQFPGGADDDNPGLEVLADDCVAGDMVACDLLYEIAPLDSDLEALGAQCGDEEGQPVAPSCRVALG